MVDQYSYQQRIVCFLDILAFSNRIKQTAKGDDSSAELLNDTCAALNYLADYKELMEKRSRISDIHVTQFSDSIVISFPWNNNKFDLFFALYSIKLFQVSALKKYRILLRGGIVIGDLIHTDTLLLGPGMIAAYEVESKCAFSPRIVLDPKVSFRYNRIKKDLIGFSEEEKRIIHKDLDDTSYVDYFNVGKGEIFASEEERLDYFKQLCQLVADNVSSSDMSIRMKYLWMRNKIKNSDLFKIPEYSAVYKKIVTDKKK